jgi:uncharacterized protein with von Willebrand factor type A (vWA) domain
MLRFDQYQPTAQGAAALQKKADGMLAIHNLAQLEDLARSLVQLIKR